MAQDFIEHPECFKTHHNGLLIRPVFIGHLPEIYEPMREAKTKVIIRKKDCYP